MVLPVKTRAVGRVLTVTVLVTCADGSVATVSCYTTARRPRPDQGTAATAVPFCRVTWETGAVARSRFRSVRYDLAAAVEVARLVDSAGGAVAGDILAPALGYSGTNNGAYLTRVANARLFGLVSGRGSRFEVTERGRRILAGDGPDALAARRDAFLSVPLFRAVADTATGAVTTSRTTWRRWLVDDFGEAATKAQTVADRLVASAGRPGCSTGPPRPLQLTDNFTNFTSVDNITFLRRIHPLGWRKRADSRPEEGAAVAENGLWLEEDSGRAPRPCRSGTGPES